MTFRTIQVNLDSRGVLTVSLSRPEVRNAFRPQTVIELKDAFEICREDGSIGVVILTGEGPDAFCSGGDQKVRGEMGYVGNDGVPRLNILDVQKQIRQLPKPVSEGQLPFLARFHVAPIPIDGDTRVLVASGRLVEGFAVQRFYVDRPGVIDQP